MVWISSYFPGKAEKSLLFRNGRRKNIPEMQANAYLIAAAPEMLETLDEVGSDLAVAFASTPGIESKIWQDILKEDIQKICAVLKKARGEE